MTLKTATKSFECDFFVHNNSELYAHLLSPDLVGIAAVFSSPTETGSISWGTETVNGYTRLGSISIDENGIQVNLSRY